MLQFALLVSATELGSIFLEDTVIQMCKPTKQRLMFANNTLQLREINLNVSSGVIYYWPELDSWAGHR